MMTRATPEPGAVPGLSRPRRRGRRSPRRLAALCVALAPAACFSEPQGVQGDTGSSASSGAGSSSSTTSIVTTSVGGTTGAGDGTTSTTGTGGDASSTGMSTTALATSGGSTSTTGDGTTTGTSGGSSSTGQVVVGIEDVVPGDIVLTEVMWNPDCLGDDCEWFELYNTAPYPIDLRTLQVQDEQGNQGIVPSTVIIEPEDFVVLARSSSNWIFLFEPDGYYGQSVSINNGTPDRVIILNQGGELDRTPLMPASGSGVTYAVLPDSMTGTGNDDPSNWCLSDTLLTTMSVDQYGTPRAPTDGCMSL